MRVNKDLELNIIVCIKQVPETTEVEFDKETGRLIREGVAAVVNPFDEYAIEEGIRLGEKYGGRVKVITMGPPWAESALKDAIAMGADEGFLATDMAFAGADTWATGFTLAKCIEKLGEYDLIICGLKTTDGDTGQTGPEIAEVLQIPHVCYVSEILEVQEVSLKEQSLMSQISLATYIVSISDIVEDPSSRIQSLLDMEHIWVERSQKRAKRSAKYAGCYEANSEEQKRGKPLRLNKLGSTAVAQASLARTMLSYCQKCVSKCGEHYDHQRCQLRADDR